MTALEDESSAGVEPDAVDALEDAAPSVSTWEPPDDEEAERQRQERNRLFALQWVAEEEARAEPWRQARERTLRISQGIEEERDPEEVRHARLRAEVEEARFRAEAQAAVAADRAGSLDLPGIFTLSEFLTAEFTGAKYLVGDLWPAGGRVVFTAYQKAGKSTTTHNLVAALADGKPFLGEFAVERPHKVALVDAELPTQTLQEWLRDQAIENGENVVPIPLRGREAAFNVMDKATRARWAEVLSDLGIEELVLDCLSPMLTALGFDEDSAARPFLDALGALCEEAGIANLLVVHHMGHGPNRARGDSRIQDWPDANWKQHRTNDRKDDSPRVFSAFGRDVSVPESRLDFDQHTRKTTIAVAAGSRKDVKVSAAVDEVVAFVTDNPGLSVRKIQDGLKDSGHSRDHIRAAVDRALEDDYIERRKNTGRGGGFCHYVIEDES